MTQDFSSTNHRPLLGAIEAGGTKFVCAVAHDPASPLLEKRFPTRDPHSTLAEAIAFFTEAQRQFGALSSLAIGSFGPIDINPTSLSYGTILTTPKAGWQGTDLIAALQQGLGSDFPIAVDTDVNAAAIGEALYGAGHGLDNVAYLTVGTGIGGGMLYKGTPIHGKMHPEIGHMLIPNLEPGHAGCCPFHTSCLEGFASGTAIAHRWKQPGAELPDSHPAWELEATYLALGALNLTATWSPDIIIFGGGVLQKEGLIQRIHTHFQASSGSYWQLPPLADYIVKAQLDQHAGIIGTLELARRASQNSAIKMKDLA